MTYQELIKNYKTVCRAYPGIVYGYTDRAAADINCITIHYVRRGNKWVETSRADEMVNYAYYLNTVTAIPFFRNWGGIERVEQAYTNRGYMPIKINSISPDRMTKTVKVFQF